MKTLIQGKNLITTYKVDVKQKTIKDENNEDVVVFTGKPELVNITEIDSWETIAEFDEIVEFNSKPLNSWYVNPFCGDIGSINLSEDEVVGVAEKITRVDLGAYVYRTNKVISEKEVGKEKAEADLKFKTDLFNRDMIESNEKLLSYCKLHKLDPIQTDVDELFELVYPDKTYSIIDGKLVVDKGITINSGGINIYNGRSPYTWSIDAPTIATLYSKF